MKTKIQVRICVRIVCRGTLEEKSGILYIGRAYNRRMKINMLGMINLQFSSLYRQAQKFLAVTILNSL